MSEFGTGFIPSFGVWPGDGCWTEDDFAFNFMTRAVTASWDSGVAIFGLDIARSRFLICVASLTPNIEPAEAVGVASHTRHHFPD